jgi:hypothetical protein
LAALHMFCLSSDNIYSGFFHAWEEKARSQPTQHGRRRRTPTFSEFQVWNPTDDELGTLGTTRACISKYIGGPKPGVCQCARTALLNGRKLTSTKEITGQLFQRSVVGMTVVSETDVEYTEYGVPMTFIRVSAFQGQRPWLLAQCKFFSSLHAHSGSRNRASHVLRGSDLTIVQGLALRAEDQFVEIKQIHDDILTLNPTRAIDPIGYNQGSWVVLQFAPGRNFSYIRDN